MTDSELTRLTHPEHAKLIPVTGTNDQPDLDNAVEVQFNPNTLKVTLSNTLRENSRAGSSRSAQYVDKSSSSLTVELIFDTTYIDAEAEQIYQRRAEEAGRRLEPVTIGSDVRELTKRIAERFIQPVGSGENMEAPSRCLFQWGAFEFLGLVQSFEETLDFFSPEGRPLRATVSLKLSEDRFQFRNPSVEQADRETPTLSATGNTAGQPEGAGPDAGASQDTSPVQQGSAEEQRNWRDTALYNGVESPRLPSAPALSVPGMSAGAAVTVSAGLGVKASAAVSVSAGAGVGAGFGVSAQATAPAFRFGASSSLGTGIEGAFVTGRAGAGLSAGSLISGGAQLRTTNNASAGIQTKACVDGNAGRHPKTGDGVGFD
jgi:hypothetical protein